MKRSIQRAKRGVLPINPVTVEEIISAFNDPAVAETYGKTVHENADLKFYNGTVVKKKYSFCVFASQKKY